MTTRLRLGVRFLLARFAPAALVGAFGCNEVLGNEPREAVELFGACDDAGSFRCAGAAQKVRLVCDGSQWVEQETCRSGENCDRETAACSPVVPGCAGKANGERYCAGAQVRECGPDLVSDEPVESCPNLCHAGECTSVTQVAAGAGYSCVLFASGRARCWGGNAANLPLCTASRLPEGEIVLDRRIDKLAAGGAHVCALLDGGAVRCWGCPDYGQLGYGSTNPVAPATARDVNLGGAVDDITAGGFHTCAKLRTGAVRCWGFGIVGQLGYGNRENVGDDEEPFSAGDVSAGGIVERLTAGVSHTCALLAGGRVRCWGGYLGGNEGQLGYGSMDNVGDDEVPSAVGVVEVGGTVIQIAAGGTHTCALLDTGRVRCWGDSNHGKLGYQNQEQIGDAPGDLPSLAGNVRVLGPGDWVIQLAPGGHHTCALVENAGVRCWGDRRLGRLGDGQPATEENQGVGDAPDELAVPVDVGDGERVMELAAGFNHTCVSLERGAVRCWGEGLGGALGYPGDENVGDDETPASFGDVPLE